MTGFGWEELGARAELGAVAQAAADAIAAVHRRPVSLRKPELTGAESVLRGARMSALIDAPSSRSLDPDDPGVRRAIDVYSVLAPSVAQQTARALTRSPMQVLARMDVLAGGPGRPLSDFAAQRVLRLGQLISDTRPRGSLGDALIPQVVHAEILVARPFGARSGLIARAACRAMAVASGFDPRGLAVPETYLNRNRAAYLEAQAGAETVGLIRLVVQAWAAGAQEAEGIARAAG
ncbi:hypothetical protein L8V23_09300 [Corynebacterium sp. c6VSa_13]|uniref:hypothetical protein n=1 Tax=Corynebacterium sp. c6VSa_13 TaxID=2913496 RepID=UPI0022BA3394|nr:hypothetical protein [Corynebacterium sp. c6VSa_13]MCZ9309953.1 hypothetical protein [Corynebacterium sp. c6VSa_13]